MKKNIILAILLISALIFTLCGPSAEEQEKGSASVEGVIAGVPAAMISVFSSAGLPSKGELSFNKQELPAIEFDFDDSTVDPDDKVTGQLKITISSLVPATMALSEGYGTPFTGIDEATWQPIFVTDSPLEDPETYFDTLIDPYSTASGVSMDGDDMTTIITDVNNVITAGSALGASISLEIQFTNFTVKEEMDYTLTGTVAYDITAAVGAKVSSSIDSSSHININDDGSTTTLDIDVSGSVVPAAKLGVEIILNSTDLVISKEGVDSTITFTDTKVSGEIAEIITISGSATVTGTDDAPIYSLDNVDIAFDTQDTTTLSGDMTIDGGDIDAEDIETAIGEAMFGPIEKLLEQLKAQFEG
jgi:hypothetical protein